MKRYLVIISMTNSNRKYTVKVDADNRQNALFEAMKKTGWVASGKANFLIKELK